MHFPRFALYTSLALFSSTALGRPQDSPNDDSDDAIPRCANGCSSAMSASALAQGSNSGNFMSGACTNQGILAAFNDCVQNSNCSDDDKEGGADWIHSTCRVVARTASATLTTSPATTTGASSTTTGSTSASTTASTTSSSTATSTPTSTPDSGLSTGAKAGIGVGVALAALLLAGALIAFCAHKMRKSRAENAAAWPDSVNGTDSAAGLAGVGAGAGAAGAAMAQRTSRFEPQDPYSAWRPLPTEPELGGSPRHELGGGQGIANPWAGAERGLPTSLAIAGGAAAAGAGSGLAAANRAGNPVVYMSELDGTSITPAAFARKPVGAGRYSSVGSDTALLSPGASAGRQDGERPVSEISSSDGGEDPADVPLPMSPVSPRSEQGSVVHRYG